MTAACAATLSDDTAELDSTRHEKPGKSNDGASSLERNCNPERTHQEVPIEEIVPTTVTGHTSVARRKRKAPPPIQRSPSPEETRRGWGGPLMRSYSRKKE